MLHSWAWAKTELRKVQNLLVVKEDLVIAGYIQNGAIDRGVSGDKNYYCMAFTKYEMKEDKSISFILLIEWEI